MFQIRNKTVDDAVDKINYLLITQIVSTTTYNLYV